MNNEEKISKATLELSGLYKDQKPIHTYAGDMAQVIKDGQGSVAKIAIAEADRNSKNIENQKPTSKKNLIYIVTAISILLISFILIIFAIYKNQAKTVELKKEAELVTSLIRTDKQTAIDMTNTTAVSFKDVLIKSIKSSTPRLNTIEHFYLVDKNTTNQLLKTDDIITKLNLKIPEELKRTLGENTTIGVHAYSGNGPFILLSVESYPQAFNSMLVWEKTIFDELYQILDIDVSNGKSYFFDSRFKDKTIQNQDTRSIIDDKNKPVLFYTFLGEYKNLLLITTKESTLKEILNRLNSAKIKK